MNIITIKVLSVTRFAPGHALITLAEPHRDGLFVVRHTACVHKNGKWISTNSILSTVGQNPQCATFKSEDFTSVLETYSISSESFWDVGDKVVAELFASGYLTV